MPRAIAVRLAVTPNGTSLPPFGIVDTPVQNLQGASGAIPFTGWALDDIELDRVAICRAAVDGETAPNDPNCAGNAEMVRAGFAWAFVKYSKRYETIEAEARKAKVGIWKGEAEPAWVFRERRWVAAQPDTPQGCAIKGNVTANGHIYHMPWSPWYDRIKIDPAKGRRWFCTEAEAVAAGWRAVNVN